MSSNESRASDFIGRQQELAVLAAALDDALSSRGQMVMLAGEPGIGKTRLAQELVGLAAARGAKVLRGWCYERQGAPPYWPWIQAMRSYVDETGSVRLLQEMGPGASDISDILPELLTKLDGLERPPAIDPEQARFRLFFSITTFLKNLSQHHPLVLVLEDLHWADESSLVLLEFLVHEIGSSPMLVIGTYRDVEISGRHRLTETLGTLVREDHFLRVQLDGLTPQEVGDLVVSRTGVAAQQDAVAALHQRTEGNPLFVGEVVGSVSPEQLAGDLAWTEGMPGAVRDAIARRLSRLSEPCAALLEIASVIGRDFDFALLRTLSVDVAEDAFLESLDEALQIRMIEALPETPGRYRFSHALIQQAVYEEIAPTRRMRAHAATGEALERLHQANVDEHAAELAHHFAESAAVTGPQKMVEYSLVAGERALDSFAYEQALVHFGRILAAKEGLQVDAETADALFGLGRAQAATLPRYELREARLNLGRAFDFYESVGDTAHIVAVAEFRFPVLLGRDLRTVDLIERALRHVPDESLAAGRLHAYRGAVQALADGDYQSAKSSVGRALAIARREGNAALEIRTLNYTAQIELWNHHFADSLKSSLAAIELAAKASDPRQEIAARYWASLSSSMLGDVQEAQRQASAIMEPAERLRDRYWLATAFHAIARWHTMKGEWEQAEEINNRGSDLMLADERLLAQQAFMYIQTGDQNEAEVYLEQLVAVVRQSEVGPTTGNAGLALVAPVARSIFGSVNQPHLGETSITAVLSSPTATTMFSTWARIGASLLAVIDDDTEAASEHYAHLKPSAGTMGYLVNVDRVLGLLAGTIGNLDDAEIHFTEAALFCRKAGYRPELAWTCYNHASVLLAGATPARGKRTTPARGEPAPPVRGEPVEPRRPSTSSGRTEPDDRAKATLLLDEALSIATELGMAPLVDKVATLQEEIGSDPAKSPAYPGGLTQREVEVLRLISGGKTDREIGEELFISVKTVGNHVSNILNKTSTANRTEAATYAARHGIEAGSESA